MKEKKYLSIIIIAVTVPFVIYGTTLILPTFDDWNTLSSPNYDSCWHKYFLRYGTVWRPFDALLGYIVSINYKMFPTLNHLLILVGHLISVFLVFRICNKMKFSNIATNIATLFYYFSPCVCGTVFSCDSFNQVYSNLFGLTALWCYLSFEGKRKYISQILFIFLAALSKENGIAWAVVPPLFSFAFNRLDKKTLYKDFSFGIVIAMMYMLIRMSLPRTEIFNPEYSTFIFTKKIKEICTLIGYTWTATDWICIMHAPSRNLIIGGLSFLLSLPFVYFLFFRKLKLWCNHTFLLLCACLIIVLSPNLLITLSVMNAYAGLSMSAIIIGYIINSYQDDTKYLSMAFYLFLAISVFTDIHHWYKSWQTSLTGKEMALETVRKTGKPVNKVYCIIIKNDEKKFSSFCVLPEDAFGWGQAVCYETGYKWPKEINNIVIPRNINSEKTALQMAHIAINKGYDCTWIVNKNKVEVVR